MARSSVIEDNVYRLIKFENTSHRKQQVLLTAAARLKLELALYDAEVAAKKPAIAAGIGAGQANLVPVRKVLKLKDGKYTAFPDLVFERSSPPKKATDEVIGVE